MRVKTQRSQGTWMILVFAWLRLHQEIRALATTLQASQWLLVLAVVMESWQRCCLNRGELAQSTVNSELAKLERKEENWQ